MLLFRTLFVLVCTLSFSLFASQAFVTVKRCDVAPQIDAELVDDAWNNALEISNFIVLREDAIAAERQSQFYLTYDDEYLYIAFRCFEEMLNPVLNQSENFKALGKNHDEQEIWRDDIVEIFLAPDANNSQHYFHLAINANAAIWDTIGMGQAEQWNGVYKKEAKTFVDQISGDIKKSAGWSCEIAIQLKSLGVEKIQEGDEWKANFCRVARTVDETSSWAQTTGRFHDPGSFGKIVFKENNAATKKISSMSELKNGSNELSGKKSVNTEIILEAHFSNGDIVEFKDIDVNKENFSVPFKLDNQNKAYDFSNFAEKDSTETFLRSASFDLKPRQEYQLQLRYKGKYEATNVNEKGYSFLTLFQPKAKYQALQPNFPFDTNGKWVTLNGSFINGDENSGTLWGLKWIGRNIKGNIQLADLQIIDADTGENVLKNGDFEQEANHWTIFHRKNLKEGYGFASENVKIRYRVLDEKQENSYLSSFYKLELAEEFSQISSQLVNFGYHGLIPIETLQICANSSEKINLLLKSQQKSEIDKVYVTLSVPLGIKLLNPKQAYYSLPEPLSVKETLSTNGERRQYKLVFPNTVVNSAELDSKQYFAVPLFFTAETASYGDLGSLELAASIDDETYEPLPLRVPVKVLPPLRAKSPTHKLPLILWVYSRQTEQMNPEAKKLIQQKVADSGYNLVPGNTQMVKEYKQLGIRTFPMLPTLTISGPYFPGMQKFIKDNPQYAAYNANGKITQTIDPAVFLSDNNPFQEQFTKVLARFMEDFNDEMHIDYEFPFLRGGTSLPQGSGVIGYSEKNLQLFKEQYSIPENDLQAEIILDKHKEKWLEFRCRQTADTMGKYREVISSINPQARFSLYSGYPPGAAANYGIDWQYVSQNVDLCMVGYGGDDALMLQTIPQKFYNSGLLLMGFVDQRGIANTYTAMLNRAGSYMGYVHYTVDGLYFYKSSLVAEIAADFEEAFLNLKDNKLENFCVDAETGKTLGDVTSFKQGKKFMILINNNSTEEKEYNLLILEENDLLAIDHETKELYENSKNIKLKVLAKSPRAISLLTKKEFKRLKIKAPEKFTSDKRIFPIIRWALHKELSPIAFAEIRYAFDRRKLSAAKLHNCPQTYFQIPEDCNGKNIFFQVRTKLADGRSSKWSKVMTVNIPEQAEKLFYENHEDNISAFGSWLPFSWGGGNQMAEFDLQKDGDSFYLEIQNEFDTTNSYWTSLRPSQVLGPAIEIKAGETYEFSGIIQANGEIESLISMRFLNVKGEAIQHKRSEIVKSTLPEGNKVAVIMKADKDARFAAFMFSGNNGPGKCKLIKPKFSIK